ncbi:cytochrome P450 [Streptomyces montanisoli]|uniref:Cytochrome P450 n=1 Tax=Streptomyces montanisoli TaxID=2798581 RepID=A0A940MD44_9ACTN|nr:cytochrome P450 [Streptomyces montanisoli]MBP0458837.1 cytochrome P450 [Streptomyces montanisoli]
MTERTQHPTGGAAPGAPTARSVRAGASGTRAAAPGGGTGTLGAGAAAPGGTSFPPLAPGRLPLVGHVVPLLRDRLAFIRKLREGGPAVRVTFGPKKMLVVNSPEMIHEMLTVKSGQFSKGLLFEKLKLFGKDALPVAEGRPHLVRRRLMQPKFHREKIGGYVTAMRDTVEPSIAAWRDGGTLDLKTEMQLMTQGVVMSVLFSSNPPRDPALTILHSVDSVFMAAIRRALLPVALLERLPTRRNRMVRDSSGVMRGAVAEIIEEHRARPEAYDDVVSLLLAARDEEGQPLAEDDILSEVTGILAAGSETTAVVMAWLFHELGRNPALERRLHQEIDTVLGGDRITLDHIGRLPFTRMCVHETLRMYSPGWLVTRQATADVRLGDVELAAGTDVIWSPYALHRDPAIYPDPDRFDPDRWSPERPQPPKEAFIPFGSGKRMCMGDAFALTEATIIAALIAQRWRLRPREGEDVRPVGEITVHPSSLHMVAEARWPAVAGRAA